ncbi:hypothetical protein SAMN05192583_2113 [Sphingomonas gellani]|uniref:Uncharacterized protein n=1 Tax=Sphingomonas gellani TaxID=1166340 RepID=A0A1H8EAW7_9SPHN|nr:hypothetical protein [Sphingomonas gellani]SEN16623.1 hypothetical protein SAMN05192583_2113 [Sphingomonas gellani]
MGTSAEIAEAVVKTTAGESINKGVWTGVVVATIGLIGLIVRQWGPWQVIARDGRRADMEGMGKRIAELEARLDRQTTSHEAKLEQERVQHGAELAIMRHRMNNLDQCLTMLLMLIEQDSEKAREAAARVRAMRERQEANEAAEKAAIHAASITAKAEPATPAAPAA